MLLMESPPISRRLVVAAIGACGAPAHPRVGSRLASKVLQAVDLGRRTAAVLRRGRRATVLLQHADATFALAPWSTWRYEFMLLRELMRVRPKAPHDLLACASADLPDHYETALEIAASGEPVAITRWGVPVSVLERATARGRDAALAEHCSKIVRLLTLKAMASTHAVPAHEWLPLSPYPWLAVLPHEGIEEFTAEIAPALTEAVRTGDPDVVFTVLSAWRSACETRADDDLVEVLKTLSPHAREPH
jgi:hypothetical protein